MKTSLIRIIIFCFVVTKVNSQVDSITRRNYKIISSYLKENLVVPEHCLKNKKFNGCRVLLKFFVSEKGAIYNTKIIKGCKKCRECEAEALRLFSEMPILTPMIKENKPIKVYYKLPIRFKVE